MKLTKEEVEKIINEIELMWEAIGKNMRIENYKGIDRGYNKLLIELVDLSYKIENDDDFAMQFLERYNIVGDDEFEAKRRFFIYIIRLFVYWQFFGQGLKEYISEKEI
jgi:hypothetical protein